MRRAFVGILAILVLPVLLVGCQREKSSDYLAYQREGGSYLCKVSYDGTVYEGILSLGESKSWEIQSPQTVAGFCFRQTGDGVCLICGDLELSIPGTSSLPCRLFGLFDLRQEDFVTADRERISGEEITVVTFSGERQLRLAPDGSPLTLSDSVCSVSILRKI